MPLLLPSGSLLGDTKESLTQRPTISNQLCVHHIQTRASSQKDVSPMCSFSSAGCRRRPRPCKVTETGRSPVQGLIQELRPNRSWQGSLFQPVSPASRSQLASVDPENLTPPMSRHSALPQGFSSELLQSAVSKKPCLSPSRLATSTFCCGSSGCRRGCLRDTVHTLHGPLPGPGHMRLAGLGMSCQYGVQCIQAHTRFSSCWGVCCGGETDSLKVGLLCMGP